VHPEGAVQVALVGPPNTGKSTLHAKLTGSHAPIGPYPFTTQYPQPGMLPYEDVHLQLVDLPPISAEHPVPWIGNALDSADGCLLMVDLCRAGCVEQVLALHEILGSRSVVLTSSWDEPTGRSEGDTSDFDPFTKVLPTLLVVTKADLMTDAAAEVEAFAELTGYDYPVLVVSTETGAGLDRIGPWLFDRLGVVRVYTKIPGKPPDMGRPFTVRRGQTVHDVAMLVHRDIAGSLRFARLWGAGAFDGQQIGKDHPMSDGDVVELHA
jgi:ribosome-interacting GTPase 1